MSWLFESRAIPSEKNGMIRARRYLGKWEVGVDGYDETTPYTNAMWRKCLRRVDKTASIKRVLVLGLGIGGSLPLIRRRFPKCRISVIEWDPKMIALYREFESARDTKPEILEGDAAEIVSNLTGAFDLILFDLYRGQYPSPLVKDEIFLRELKRLLSWNGYLLCNVFREKDALGAIDRFFFALVDVSFQIQYLRKLPPFRSRERRRSFANGLCAAPPG